MPEETAVPLKRKPGRPRIQREKLHEPVHRGRAKPEKVLITRNGKTYEYLGDDSQDRLYIGPDEIPEGMVYLWVMKSILGQEQPNWFNRRKRTGWDTVPASRHPGRFTPKDYEGVIEVDGLILCEKPVEFVNRDKIKDKRNAAEQVWLREQAMRSGNLDNIGFDTQHPRAVATNKIGKTYEAIPVPKNNYEREQDE